MPSESTRNWTLWLTCDACGDIELRASHAVLRYSKDTGSFTVSYQCPQCRRRECIGVIDSHVLGALFAAGMVPVPWAFAPEAAPNVAPLTAADVEVAASQLALADWFDANCPRP
jgi:hypothetical protein